ncbi:MAG: precorrin-6y C5,15-methyltransferase (decarboxylating) subunit CbiE [Thermosynechococcaceae cyanobacterium]
MSPIFVVGIGLAGATDLSPAAQTVVEQATLLVGGQRHLRYFPAHPAPQVMLGDLAMALEQIEQHVTSLDAATVVILASGDPLFFGLGRLLLTAFPADQLTFYPHLSAVQIAFNRIKVPWQDANVISLHGRSPDQLIKALQRGDPKLAIFTDPYYTPSAIARLFLDLDLPLRYDMWVCEDLEGPSEQIQKFDPQNLLEQTFATLNIVILLRNDPIAVQEEWPCLGLPDHSFLSFPDRPSLMTKQEIRVLAIAQLNLHPHQIIWDIGAGTGSVSIEMARVSPSSTIFAIEKSAVGHRLIQKNCERFNINNIQAVHGEAPQSLSDLPHPARIFIGGSGGHLTAILEFCQAYHHSHTQMVLAIATLENFETARQWLQNHNWSMQLLQVQISRSVTISTMTRWNPLNPVMLIQAQPQTPK